MQRFLSHNCVLLHVCPQLLAKAWLPFGMSYSAEAWLGTRIALMLFLIGCFSKTSVAYVTLLG